MKDQFGREIDYLRLSITDRCNLRCSYCMPSRCQWLPMSEILSLEEIATISRLGAELGIRKLKVTGGEPLIRKGSLELMRTLKTLPGIEQVTLTTNGVLLAQYAAELKGLGLDGVNVSLDTLDPAAFARITGRDLLPEVLRGIDAALEQGLKVKVNAVLQPGVNADQWPQLLELARDRAMDVRFIEMMPIGSGRGLPSIANRDLLAQIEQRFGPLPEDDRPHGNGPAVYRTIPGFRGSVGFISAIHGKFCDRCNRVRLSSTGWLKGCLCFEDGADLKEPLRQGDLEAVRERFARVVRTKPQAHCFDRPTEISERQGMSKIGG